MEKPEPNPATATLAARPPRQRLQFRLRTLMLAMLVFPIGLGWLAQERSKSQKAWANVEAIEKHLTTYSFLEWRKAPWWQRTLGIDLPRNIEEFDFIVPDGNEHIQVQVLTRLRAFPRLKRLSISNVSASATALKPLEHFSMLEDLKISGIHGGGEQKTELDGLLVIAKLPRLKRFFALRGQALEYQDLLFTMTSLDDLTLATGDLKMEFSRLKNLRRFCLFGNRVQFLNNDRHKLRVNGNYAVSQIAKLERLEYLELSADCSTEGLRPLLQIKTLKHLSLRSDRITDNDLAMLAEMPSLEILELDSIDVTQEAIDNWKAKRPELTITKK